MWLSVDCGLAPVYCAGVRNAWMILGSDTSTPMPRRMPLSSEIRARCDLSNSAFSRLYCCFCCLFLPMPEMTLPTPSARAGIQAAMVTSLAQQTAEERQQAAGDGNGLPIRQGQ